MLGQGAVVLLITDGLDRDGAHGLAENMDRLHRSCRRLIWLNPLLRWSGFEPKSQGIRAMLPHVDEFRPVHNLASLRALVDLLSRPAPHRRGMARLERMDRMNTAEAEDVLGTAAAWRAAGEQVAIATVTETWGSSPRPAGSQMAVTKSGRMAGSVSGGCIEGAVADAAMKTIDNRHAATAGFRRQPRTRLGSRPGLRRQGEGVRGEAELTSRQTRAPRNRCTSGLLDASLQRPPPCRRMRRYNVADTDRGTEPSMTPEILAALEQAKRDKRPVVLATRLPSGEQQLLPDPVGARRAERGRRRARCDRDESGTVKLGDTDWFLHAYNPPLRLIVVGAVHIAQALVPFAVPCGFAVTVVDPRRSFASDERFPGVDISTDWPDEAMDAFAPDSRTAVVTLTHDPKLDDPALDRALKSQAFYIGALGSRRTHAARLKRLRELGHGDNALARIQRPGRPEHRGGHRAGNRAVDHRRDRRRPPRRAAAAETALA